MFGFGKKKQEDDKMKELKEIKKDTPKKPSRKGLILKVVVLVVILGLTTYGGYLYTESVKAKAYVQGGDDAIDMVRQAAEKGGVEIEMGGEVVKLTKYYKPIGEQIVSEAEKKATVVETPSNEASDTTNSTDESTNSTS